MTRRDFFHTALAGAAPALGSRDDCQTFAQRIFNRANELRVIRGVPPLRWSEPIVECAREQSARKVLLRFPGHNDPERGDVAARLSAAGVGWSRCAENLFMEKGWDDPVNFAIVFWWYSAGHQANMLNPDYTHTGVAVMQGADGAFFATQIFVEAPEPGIRPRR